MKAIVIPKHGGPEVMKLEERPMPAPHRTELLVHNQAIGVNFVDTQHRAGLNYPVALPLIPGIEAVGVVAATGPDVSTFQVGDRVGYAGYMGGNYAEYTLVREEKLVPIPANLNFEIAAAALMQGLTAHCLTHSVYAIQPKDIVLVHAAAGGVGLFLVQMAKQRGATVIGTASTALKAQFARSLGADHVINYADEDFEAETMRLTEGLGVQVVYDAVGQATFDKGLNVLRAKGHMVVYGLSSGPIPPFDINRLSGIAGHSSQGSLHLTWATASDYTRERADLLWHAEEVLQWAADGTLTAPIARTLPLSEAAEAHRLLESREVVGKVILIP